jgi:ribonucleoside-diphosphate reductase alpha chain
MITVIKRDERKEALDVNKVKKYTRDAVKGLINVSQEELEKDAILQFRDGMKTEEIQHTLIQTAVDKINVDCPDWTFVASRLFIYDIYHRVGKATEGEKGKAYTHLSNYFQAGEREGRIVTGLREQYDLDDLTEYLKPERDMQFNYLGIKTLTDRYLLKNRAGEPIELPQQMFMGVAMFLAQNEEDKQGWAKKFYDILSRFEVMAATPTLSNARTPRHQLSSCFIGSTPDNIEGIFDGYTEKALLSKFGGGIGWDWTKVRASASSIDGHKNAAGGMIPFLKIENDLAIAVDQLGTRKGAIAVYVEPWHMDILDFLDLKKNSGEERRRAHDLFPAVWLNDIFMERVESNASWTLFDPYTAPLLADLHGDKFNAKYLEYEADDTIPKVSIKAKDLWKKMILSYFETGSPFLGFKDTANKSNPNDHAGIIRSSNLCTEIFQNTQPNEYKVKIEFADGEIAMYNEDDIVEIGSGITKKANKLSSIDILYGKKIYHVSKVSEDGLTAVCNLASVNLSKVNTKEKIEAVIPVAVRMLDNVIDLNFYPARKVRSTNELSRAIGLGVMGEAQMLAEAAIVWGSKEHYQKVDGIMEMVSYNTISTSSDLSVEKGSYPTFEGSKWSRGIMPIDSANKEAIKLIDREHTYDWDALREKVKRDGMRNGYLMAIAPTSSISILTGTTQTIEPVYKRKWFEENLSGLIPVCVPNLTAATWQYYTTAYDLDQKLLIEAAAIRQKWIDQGQSLNVFITLDKASGKVLNSIYMYAWKLGCKSTYYLRSQSPEAVEENTPDTMDRSLECAGCQ